MKVLPIGSVVKVNGQELVILGYPRGQKDGHYKYAYVGLHYLKGYEDKNSFQFFELEDGEEVLFQGYLSEQGKEHTERITRASENAKKISIETLNALMEIAEKKIKENDKEAEV